MGFGATVKFYLFLRILFLNIIAKELINCELLNGGMIVKHKS